MQIRNISFLKKILNKRTYYAATLGQITKPIEARISNRHDKNDIRLETFEVHSHLEPFSEVDYQDGYQTIKRIINSNDDYLIPSWDTRFTINHKGLIHSQHYNEGCFSTELKLNTKEYANREGRYKDNKYSLIEVWTGRFVPDLLYAIPQATWDDFIFRLPYQSIVEILNLSVHRHLWVAYNYSASARHSELRRWRADAFSKYHFLISFIDPVNEENCFHDKSHPWKEMIDQGVIAQGKMIDKLAERYGLFVTPLYLKKFSHCPSWGDFYQIGRNLITPKAQSVSNESVNLTKLNEYIAALPSSKKEPIKFEKMISDSRVLQDTYFSEKIKARIFYHARENFGLFKKNITFEERNLSDYYSALFSDMIFPEIARRLFETPSDVCAKYNISHEALHDEDCISEVYYLIKREFVTFLFEHIHIEKLLLLNERWHRNVATINSRKPQATMILRWHALFDSQLIDNTRFTCLVTEAALKEEGGKMSHCVGGYSAQCLSGDTHIISVQTSCGEHSTMELNTKNNEIVIKQNSTYRNKPPCNKILNASERLLNRLKNDKIQLNLQRGKINLPSQQVNKISEFYPYPISDQHIQESIYQAYKYAQVLPSFLTTDNYRNMIEKLSKKFDLAGSTENAVFTNRKIKDTTMRSYFA